MNAITSRAPICPWKLDSYSLLPPIQPDFGMFYLGKCLVEGSGKASSLASAPLSCASGLLPEGGPSRPLQHQCLSISRLPCCGPRNTWPAAALLPSLAPDTHSAPSEFSSSTLQPHYCERMCFLH